MAGEWDAFRSRAGEAMASGKVLAGQLGAEESAHRLTKGALNEALAAVEASQIEAVVLKGAIEGEFQSPCFVSFSLCLLPDSLA